MSPWSAASLMAGYPRSVVGFDFRVWMQDQGNCRATIDNRVWSRQPIQDCLLATNGINLFDGSVAQFSRIKAPRDSIRVAFDLPTALVKTMASTFGIVPLVPSVLSPDKGWKFIGYDIIDARTQSSGLYSFDWTKTEFASMRSRLSLDLNSRGLVDDELLAIKCAIFFDTQVTEHAPFAPCGIWVAGEHVEAPCQEARLS